MGKKGKAGGAGGGGAAVEAALAPAAAGSAPHSQPQHCVLCAGAISSETDEFLTGERPFNPALLALPGRSVGAGEPWDGQLDRFGAAHCRPVPPLAADRSKLLVLHFPAAVACTKCGASTLHLDCAIEYLLKQVQGGQGQGRVLLGHATSGER